MYLEFYGFRENPFSMTPDPHFFYPSRRHEEALFSLLYTIRERKGFAVVTGEIGAGKTTVCRALLDRLDAQTRTAVVTNTYLTGKQLIALALEDFGVPAPRGSKLEILKRLNEFLIEQLACGNNCVLIIDEAQNLPPAALEEVRMLSNLETEKEKLIQIILVGQPELRAKLALPALAQLRQRVNVSYHVGPLSREEVFEYVEHRLRVAGGEGSALFSEGALEAVYGYSGGIPRVVNMLCDRALLVGYVAETKVIDRGFVLDAAEELGIEQDNRSAQESRC